MSFTKDLLHIFLFIYCVLSLRPHTCEAKTQHCARDWMNYIFSLIWIIKLVTPDYFCSYSHIDPLFWRENKDINEAIGFLSDTHSFGPCLSHIYIVK